MCIRDRGIVEHPIGVIRHRLNWSDPSHLECSDFDPHSPPVDWWSDGSVLWPDIFWLSSGGFAIVDHCSREVFGGPVFHLQISSYTTELWAVVVAIHKCTCPTKVFSDCQTIVDQFAVLCEQGDPCGTWSHLAWWQAIAKRRRDLIQHHPSPFTLTLSLIHI